MKCRYFGLVQASARCGLGLRPTFLLVTAGLHCPFGWTDWRPVRTLELIGRYEFTSRLFCGNSLTAKQSKHQEFYDCSSSKKKVSIIITLPPRILHPN